MWKWKAQLNIEINDVRHSTILVMTKIHRYHDLHKSLPEILRENGLDRKYNASQQEVCFYLFYQDVWKFIDNWSNFILNRDHIFIKIVDLPPVYSIIEMKNKRVLQESKNIKDIYNYYRQNQDKIIRGVIIKQNNFVIDVLDSGEYHYNQCVNRMVHDRNY